MGVHAGLTNLGTDPVFSRFCLGFDAATIERAITIPWLGK